MKSPILALLLIASVMACPLRCLSCKANVAACELSAAPACSCCTPCPVVPELDSPASNDSTPSDDDCRCQACICEGAVVEADVELSDQWLDSKPVFGSAAPIIAARQLAGHSTARHIELLMHGSLASSRQLLYGRDARIAYQSWLI